MEMLLTIDNIYKNSYYLCISMNILYSSICLECVAAYPEWPQYLHNEITELQMEQRHDNYSRSVHFIRDLIDRRTPHG